MLLGGKNARAVRIESPGLQTKVPHSGSVGSLNNTVSLILPWPYCGKFGVAGCPGSRLEAVSSGGNNTSEFRNVITLCCEYQGKAENALREFRASPPWRRMISLSVMLRPSCP